ncbi:hypothetical protein AURDEDRAFT_66659 [Auricularia subglabra TFB-10046 SS5]|nr:hypothetical protein AURDEDRAFT_66659 [Auricularia subglabra TFB-10046 SS5]
MGALPVAEASITVSLNGPFRTSIHWHGIRQLHNNINDGVNGVTECPLAPDDTKVYRFVAEQYGTLVWGCSASYQLIS